jgi:hypothetical protein
VRSSKRRNEQVSKLSRSHKCGPYLARFWRDVGIKLLSRPDLRGLFIWTGGIMVLRATLEDENMRISSVGFVSGHGFTGCGKSRFAARSQPSAAKAALIQQLLRMG